MASRALCLLFGVAFVSVRESFAVTNVPVKTYIMNTSLSAKEQYAPICAEKRESAIAAFKVMLDEIPKLIRSAFEDIALSFWKHSMTEPYKSEIEYFSECS